MKKNSLHIFFLGGLLSFLVTGCGKGEFVQEVEGIVTCGAEKVENDRFVNEDNFFGQGFTQSDDHAHSGKYSSKLNKSKSYGMTITLEDLRAGESIRASVWRKTEGSEGDLILSVEDKEIYVKGDSTGRTEDGWTEFEFYYTAGEHLDEVDIYCYNASNVDAYFDDLTVERIWIQDYTHYQEAKIEINIPESSYDSIANFVKIALEQNLISDDLKQYFDAEIVVDGETIPVELRLKGDWTDHVQSDKWSFRIKVKGNHSYRGLKSFSIQSPYMRNMLTEWFVHDLLEQEDILTTRYEFVPVSVNGRELGVYAVEEHFDKQLLESRNRREAPIVKFDESGFWESNLYDKTHDSTYRRPFFESAEIKPFKGNRTRKNEVLKKQFQHGKNQLERFRQLDEKIEDYLDIERMARFIAISDLTHAYHGLAWHNLRFYVNPVTGLLEPVAFDCHSDQAVFSLENHILGTLAIKFDVENLTSVLFNNTEFQQHYLANLKKFSQEDYVQKFIDQRRDEIRRLENILIRDFPGYNFDVDYYLDNAARIRQALPIYAKLVSEGEKVKVGEIDFQELPEGVHFEKISLKAYTNSLANGKASLTIENFHSSSITILSFRRKDLDDKWVSLQQPLSLDAFEGSESKISLTVDGLPRRIRYSVENCPGEVFVAKISKWEASKYDPLYPEFKEIEGWKYEGSNIRIPSGLYILNEDVYIPSGRNVTIDAGAQLVLNKNAAIISRSPIQARGQDKKRIKFTSYDQTGQGVLIMSKKKSHWNNVTVQKMNTITRHNWQLTGAITFYDSKVLLENCYFFDNSCEDGLNLIRSTFKMESCQIRNTHSDGFDADFCTGIMRNCKVSDTKNDAIDVSGSKVAIVNCQLNSIGDKGISGGEDSEVYVLNSTVTKAGIGVASKDKSRVLLSGVKIKEANVGLAAFKKKAEHGTASIETANTSLVDSKEERLLDIGSTISLNGELFEGEKEIDVDALYAPFNASK